MPGPCTGPWHQAGCIGAPPSSVLQAEAGVGQSSCHTVACVRAAVTRWHGLALECWTFLATDTQLYSSRQTELALCSMQRLHAT